MREGSKGGLRRLLAVEANTCMKITESFAMWPGSSVSGLCFAHPESRYFSLGKIDRDQVADYAERKGMRRDTRSQSRPGAPGARYSA
jgi:5-methyltetrahydrofolate--homocysteine methyltransferase